MAAICPGLNVLMGEASTKYLKLSQVKHLKATGLPGALVKNADDAIWDITAGLALYDLGFLSES